MKDKLYSIGSHMALNSSRWLPLAVACPMATPQSATLAGWLNLVQAADGSDTLSDFRTCSPEHVKTDSSGQGRGHDSTSWKAVSEMHCGMSAHQTWPSTAVKEAQSLWIFVPLDSVRLWPHPFGHRSQSTYHWWSKLQWLLLTHQKYSKGDMILKINQANYIVQSILVGALWAKPISKDCHFLTLTYSSSCSLES